VDGFEAFAEAERAGWGNAERAAGYVALLAVAADQVIESLLSARLRRSGCCGRDADLA
jgi:hypothetical protein